MSRPSCKSEKRRFELIWLVVALSALALLLPMVVSGSALAWAYALGATLFGWFLLFASSTLGRHPASILTAASLIAGCLLTSGWSGSDAPLALLLRLVGLLVCFWIFPLVSLSCVYVSHFDKDRTQRPRKGGRA